MTQLEAIELTRLYLNATNKDTGLYGETSLKKLLNKAQQSVFGKMVEIAPNRFLIEEEKAVTFTNNKAKVRGTGKVLTYDAQRIDAITYEYSQSWPNLVGNRSFVPYYSPRDFQSLSREYTSQWPHGWTQINEYIYMVDVPTTALELRFVYLPVMADMSGSVDVFGGLWPEFHHLVPLRCANLIANIMRESNDGLLFEEDTAWKSAALILETQQQAPLMPSPAYGD